jgi:hypothetical protein
LDDFDVWIRQLEWLSESCDAKCPILKQCCDFARQVLDAKYRSITPSEQLLKFVPTKDVVLVRTTEDFVDADKLHDIVACLTATTLVIVQKQEPRQYRVVHQFVNAKKVVCLNDQTVYVFDQTGLSRVDLPTRLVWQVCSGSLQLGTIRSVWATNNTIWVLGEQNDIVRTKWINVKSCEHGTSPDTRHEAGNRLVKVVENKVLENDVQVADRVSDAARDLADQQAEMCAAISKRTDHLFRMVDTTFEKVDQFYAMNPAVLQVAEAIVQLRLLYNHHLAKFRRSKNAAINEPLCEPRFKRIMFANKWKQVKSVVKSWYNWDVKLQLSSLIQADIRSKSNEYDYKSGSFSMVVLSVEAKPGVVPSLATSIDITDQTVLAIAQDDDAKRLEKVKNTVATFEGADTYLACHTTSMC